MLRFQRLFMVRNVGCVHDAALSVGTGRFDFLADAEVRLLTVQTKAMNPTTVS